MKGNLCGSSNGYLKVVNENHNIDQMLHDIQGMNDLSNNTIYSKEKRMNWHTYRHVSSFVSPLILYYLIVLLRVAVESTNEMKYGFLFK